MKTGAQKLPTRWEEREKLREKGQFWTPAWVAQAMVAYAAENASMIFDPAAGRGAFFDALLALDKPHVGFFGIDNDAEVLGDEIYRNERCEVELRDFIQNPPGKRFSAIVANPPYIRHHRLDEKTKAFMKQLCRKITGFTIDGRAGYHVYFLLQALYLLEEKGRLSFIAPADLCEGTFAPKIWRWIAENFCLEAVVTFAENAAPFPNVATNALVFFIKKQKPRKSFFWVRAANSHSTELLDFVLNGFQPRDFGTLEITCRQIAEAVGTGLSRPPQRERNYKYRLENFAAVMRGIATGANEFFFLTERQIQEQSIPNEFLKLAIGKTRNIPGDTVTLADIENLKRANQPTFLLQSANKPRFPKRC